MNSFNDKIYFNQISSKYIVNELSSFCVTRILRKQLVNKISSYKNKNVLDIMSGRGENVKQIKDLNNSTLITTIDISDKMNGLAKKALSNFNIKQIENDFFNTSFINQKFDVVLCSFGIKTINPNKLNQFSKKINEIISEKGEVLLLEMVKPNSKAFYKLITLYIEKIVSNLFGKEFTKLNHFIEQHKNMNQLKEELVANNLTIIEHKRILDLFEIIHAKKQMV